MVERWKEIQSVQHILINMGGDNNSLSENNKYICTLSGMFEEMVERGKEIQSVQHILINMGKDNNSLPENKLNMTLYICTLSGMFEEMVERGKEITLIYTLHYFITKAHSFCHSFRLFRFRLNNWRSVPMECIE